MKTEESWGGNANESLQWESTGLPCLLSLFSAGQAMRLTMTGVTCRALFMLPLLFPSSAAKASPAVTAASSSGTGNDSERICTLRPDVSLENPMLPVALKGEQLSGSRPVCGCAPASFPGVQVRERLGTCVLQNCPLSLGALPGR